MLEDDTLEPTFTRPDAVEQLPLAVRQVNVKESDDICVIGPSVLVRASSRAVLTTEPSDVASAAPREQVTSCRYFVRGVLPVIVTDRDEETAWGIWVELDVGSFFRIVDIYDDILVPFDESAVFEGLLANDIPGYEPTVGLRCHIHPSTPETRPLVELLEDPHPFAQACIAGVTTGQVQTWFRDFHRAAQLDELLATIGIEGSGGGTN